MNFLWVAAIVSAGAVRVHATSGASVEESRAIFDSGGKTLTDRASSGPVVPRGFSSYNSAQVGEGVECVVGAIADEDGMNTRPHAYLHEQGIVGWSKGLEMPGGFYQGRATHCLLKDGSLYVLIQFDTQSQQSLSQTFLQIARLGYLDGSVEDVRDVDVPDLRLAYSSWVCKGNENFRNMDDAIRITGRYCILNSEDVQPFSAVVKM